MRLNVIGSLFLSIFLVVGYIMTGGKGTYASELVFEVNGDGPRYEKLLNGTWDFLPVATDKPEYPPEGDWQKRSLPNSLVEILDKEHRSFWYRQNIFVPSDLKGKQIKLKLSDVKYRIQVYVNGQYSGEHTGALTPFIIDISKFIKFGETNELSLTVTDWTVFYGKKLSQEELNKIYTESRWTAERLDYKYLTGPLTYLPDWPAFVCGIYGDILILACPKVYVEDVFVITSTRKKEIGLQITLKNEENTRQTFNLKNFIFDGKDLVKELPSQEVKISPLSEKIVKVVDNWENPQYWSLDTPHLYNLSTVIENNGKKVDVCNTRFGFREFWAEDGNFVLNGVPVKLCSTVWTVQEGYDRMRGLSSIIGGQRENEVNLGSGLRGLGVDIEDSATLEEKAKIILQEAKKVYRMARLLGANGTTLFPTPADEVGFLLIDEAHAGPYWGGWHDPRWWDNLTSYLKEMIKSHRNHPSIVMWSLGNEIYPKFFPDPQMEYWKRYAGLSDVIRAVDPTRPILFSGSGDPYGKADVISFHYFGNEPFMHQSRTNIYPDDAYFLDKPREAYILTPSQDLRSYSTQKDWVWKREKPLFIGEMGADYWDPNSKSFFLGDEGYRLYKFDRSKALWDNIGVYNKMAIEAFHYYGVSGWGFGCTPIQALSSPYYEKLNAPLGVFCQEYNHNFYSGQEAERSLVVRNDQMKPGPANLRLLWEIELEKEVIQRGERSVKLQPTEIEVCKVKFTTPMVKERKEILFKLSLYEKDRLSYTDTYQYSIFPRITSLSLKRKVFLYNPDKIFGEKDIKIEPILKKLNIDYIRINRDALSKPIEPNSILIMGNNASDGSVKNNGENLTQFVERGGRIIFLQQKSYPDWLPIELKTDPDHPASTICFKQADDHPILRDIEPEDLKFWGKDHIVSRDEFKKPSKGNFKVIIDTGGAKGLLWTPLLEAPYGKGFYLFSQLELTEKFDMEPSAGILFYRMLEYADQVSSKELKKAALLTEKDSPLLNRLGEIGLSFNNLVGELSKEDLSNYGLLIVSGNSSIWQEVSLNREKIKKFVEDGGHLWLHRLDADSSKIVSGVLNLNISIKPEQSGQIVKIDTDEVTSGLSNCELYWPGAGLVFDMGTSTNPVVNYTCLVEKSPGVKVLTEPAGLVKISNGHKVGYVLIDQICWDTEEKNRVLADRFVSILLTNLGARLNSPFTILQKQLTEGEFKDCFFADLRPYCNRGFKGRNWMEADNADMRYFPTGIQLMQDIPFKVIESGARDKTCIMLSGKGISTIGGVQSLPREVRGIEVNKSLSKLYFLQNCGFARKENEGELSGAYLIHYEDKTKQEIPIRLGKETSDWCTGSPPSPLPNADVGWVNDELASRPYVVVYLMEWENPYPDKVITSIDFISGENYSNPILIAITGKL